MQRGILVFILLLISMASFSQVVLLDTDKFDKKLKETQKPVLLDVRTSDEFKSGHLSQAVLMDINAGDFKAKAAQLDKSKPVFVYCAAGVRSSKAATLLKDLGFQQIYDLSGGIRAWSQAGKPVVK